MTDERQTSGRRDEGQTLPERVLMTADTVGGVWQYAIDLAAGLSARGIEVMIAAMGGRASEAQRVHAASVPGLHLEESDFKLEWMTDPWRDVRDAGTWLLDLAADFNPDFIQLNNFAHGALAWERPVLMVGHSCVFSWFEAVECCAPPPEWRRYRIEVSRGLAAAGEVTAPSGAMLRSLERHYGRFRQGAPIYNGADPCDFDARPKEAIVFGAGRLWDSAKNLSLLDQVAGQIDWPVYVAGSTRHPDGGEATFSAARSLGFLSREEMREWLGRSAIYVLPARYEPFGLSALEAALSGCALILGDIPTLREIWADSAILIDPRDPVALRDAVNDLIANPTKRIALARRAHMRALRYSSGKMVRGYLASYSNLLQTAPRPRLRMVPRRPQPSRRASPVPAPRPNN